MQQLKNKNYSIPATVVIQLATLIALTIAYLCSGCETFKNFSRNKSDTASVKKSAVAVSTMSEAAAVRTEDNKSHEENEWFRLTLKYLSENKDGPAPALIRGDTTINHFITQPATVIYEGGKSSRDEEIKTVDSTWYYNMMKMTVMAVDSVSRKLDNYEKTKHSETKGPGWITLVLIGLGLIALNKLLAARY